MVKIKGSTVLYQITLKGLCFGLLSGVTLVIDAPPVARWCIGKQLSKMVDYWKRRGAKVELIKKYVRC